MVFGLSGKNSDLNELFAKPLVQNMVLSMFNFSATTIYTLIEGVVVRKRLNFRGDVKYPRWPLFLCVAIVLSTKVKLFLQSGKRPFLRTFKCY